MKKINHTNALLIFLMLAVFILLVFSVVTALTGNTIENIFSRPSGFEALTPGKTTLQDVKKTLGEPESVRKSGGDTSLFYKTQSEDYKDRVSVEDERVKFSLENVFDSSKGYLSDYKKKYGNPDIIMYDPKEEVVIWNIFLNEGVGIAAFYDDEIARLLYFKKQDRDNFLKNIAPSIGLQLEKPLPKEEGEKATPES